MRTPLTILMLTIFPVMAAAQQHVDSVDDPRQEQVQAAVSNAMSNLRDQVLRTRLSRDLLVSDFLDQTRSLGELDRVLKGAEPVGGPRWVDDQTCQVRLELPESQVGAMLMGIAHSPHQHSPIRPDVLKVKFSDWSRLNFSVVGSSAGGDAIELARPGNTAGNWSEISDSIRRVTVADARSDAARQLLKEIGLVKLDAKITVADALSRPVIAERFNRWLARQPVTKIEFLDDLKVLVTISAPPGALGRALKSSVAGDPAFSSGTAIDWEQVNRQIEALPPSVEGTATAVVAPQATTRLSSVVLPLQPPGWLDQQLDAEGTADRGKESSGLKRSRVAEADAVRKIRDQFLLLRIDSATTLGDACRIDGQLSSAVDRAMLLSHTYRADYLADGSVTVRVSLDLRAAWDALRSNP